MDELKDKLIEALLNTLTYDEMNEEQEKLVVEYETNKWKQKVDELRNEKSVEELKEQIHSWWLDYQIADGTEENLLTYI